MTNAFVDLLRTADQKQWCVKPFCTTCGAAEYRSALSKLAFDPLGPLFFLLNEVTEADIAWFAEWQDALLVAFMSLLLPRQAEDVLAAWVNRPANDLRLTDFVLFRIVRRMAPSALRQEWIDRGIGMALQSRDFSLVETLLIVLGSQAKEHPQLLRVAEDIAIDSRQMRRVLRNKVGIEPPSDTK